MANNCFYSMKIVGEKENVYKLISYLQAYYEYDSRDNWKLVKCTADKHFFRVFDAYHKEDNDEVLGDGKVASYVSGDCAWSVISCMFANKLGTYYDSWKKDGTTENPDFRGTHMAEATEELDLVVEIFSEESGCGFMEHFLVDKGKILIEECVDWCQLYDEDGEPIYDENGDQVTEGGLDWNYTI